MLPEEKGQHTHLNTAIRLVKAISMGRPVNDWTSFAREAVWELALCDRSTVKDDMSVVGSCGSLAVMMRNMR